MSAFDSLLIQLKRRHVYRVAVVYAAVGWLLVQIVTQVFPVFSFPTWTEQLAVLVMLGGFPVALILAWAYELKPDGVHRDSSAQVDPGRNRNHRADIAIGLLVVLSLAVTTVIWAVHRTPEKPGQATLPALAQTPTQAPPRSVAVLPFDNMSGDPNRNISVKVFPAN